MEIMLVRHGKPEFSLNNKMSASGFSKWVRYYNQSNISAESTPPLHLANNLENYFVVSSDLNRAIHSAVLCVDKPPDLMLKELREMDIPRFKVPLKLKANSWLLLNRLLWFCNFHGQVESFRQAKHRAKLVAHTLVELANNHGKVVVFSHGLINKYVAKELVELGWNGSFKRQKHWGSARLNT